MRSGRAERVGTIRIAVKPLLNIPGYRTIPVLPPNSKEGPRFSRSSRASLRGLGGDSASEGDRMLRLLGTRRVLCDGLSRRDLLHIGGLGAFGLALGDFLGLG